jgi:O-antigen/teichoic acid export membrane protein
MIVARNLSQSDVGILFFIQSNVAIFVVLRSLIPFWLKRNYARGKDIAFTGIVTNLIISIPFFLGYVLILPFFGKQVWVSPLHFSLASSFIFFLHALSSLRALVSAKTPHKLAYDLAIGELVKILGFPIIVKYQLTGVITVTIISYIAQIIFLSSTLKLSWKIQPAQIKTWFVSSWVLILGLVGNTILQNVDKYFLGLFSLESLGFYSVYNLLTSKIASTTSLASGLYPKLLSEKRKSVGKDIEAILSLTTMFSIPMTLGGIFLARDLVSILGSKYLYTDMVNETLFLMFITAFIGVLDSVFSAVIIGSEQVDVETLNHKAIIKSKLFVNNIISYLGVIISIPSLYVIVPLYGIYGVAFIYLMINCIHCSIRFFLARNSISFRIPLKNMAKYFGSAIIMVIVLFLLPHGKGSIITTAEVLFGFLIYICTLWIIDANTRELTSVIIKEIKTKEK